MKKNNLTELNEEIAITFVKQKTGIDIDGFWGHFDRKTNTVIKPVQNVLYYHKHGDLPFVMRPHTQPFVCPRVFEKEYQLFQKEYRERNYANATMLCNNNILHRLLYYLDNEGVLSTKEITALQITEFLALYAEKKPKYVATVLYVLRNYFSFLKESGLIEEDLVSSLPKVRVLRNSSIPHSWKTEDIHRLLDSIDRGSPKGKRDYALLLIIVRLGLRVSDIRSMKLSSLNWARKNHTYHYAENRTIIGTPSS